MTASDLRTKKEVAKQIRQSLRSVDNLLAARAIEYVRIGRSVRFTQEAVDRFIASRTVNSNS